MKKLLLFMSFQVFIFTVISAQQKHPEILSAGGGISTTPNLSVEWTLGEPAVQIARHGTLLLTEGFHQPVLVVNKIDPEHPGQLDLKGAEITGSPVEIDVFPNPYNTSLHVRFQSPTVNPVNVTVTSLEGKVVSETEVLPGTSTISLDMQNHPSGVYLLHVRGKEAQIFETFKISKI